MKGALSYGETDDFSYNITDIRRAIHTAAPGPRPKEPPSERLR